MIILLLSSFNFELYFAYSNTIYSKIKYIFVKVAYFQWYQSKQIITLAYLKTACPSTFKRSIACLKKDFTLNETHNDNEYDCNDSD